MTLPVYALVLPTPADAAVPPGIERDPTLVVGVLIFGAIAVGVALFIRWKNKDNK